MKTEDARATDHSVSDLLRCAQQFHSALRPDICYNDTQVITWAPFETLALRQLYRTCQQTHPDAGKPFWRAHCWSTLIWRTVYLQVLATHCFNRVLNIQSLQLLYRRGSLYGFRVNQTPWLPCDKDPTRNIALAAQQLKHCVKLRLAQCQHFFCINPMLAETLTADILLGALQRLPYQIPSLEVRTLLSFAQHWLEQLAWTKTGALYLSNDTPGAASLQLQRKSCCYFYRTHQGEMCSNCPKNPACSAFNSVSKESLQ